jgi:hypothetical protein
VEEDFYTLQEAARILRTTERTVRRCLGRGGETRDGAAALVDGV